MRNFHPITNLNVDNLTIEVKNQKYECGFGCREMSNCNFYFKNIKLRD